MSPESRKPDSMPRPYDDDRSASARLIMANEDGQFPRIRRDLAAHILEHWTEPSDHDAPSPIFPRQEYGPGRVAGDEW